jgi:hypothetical protein
MEYKIELVEGGYLITITTSAFKQTKKVVFGRGGLLDDVAKFVEMVEGLKKEGSE